MNTSPTPTLSYVTEQTFEREVLNSELPVLIEFSATWCGPCKQVEPDLVALKHELAGRAQIVKIDVDKSPTLAQEFQIKSVPTFMVVHQGRVVAGQPGAIRRAQMRTMIEPFLPRSESAIRIDDFVKLLKEARVIPVDTRDLASFTRAHIPGAMHIPLAEVADKIMEAMSTGRAPVIYCRAGIETKELAEQMAETGFPVAFLEGGFLSWEVAGGSIERG